MKSRKFLTFAELIFWLVGMEDQIVKLFLLPLFCVVLYVSKPDEMVGIAGTNLTKNNEYALCSTQSTFLYETQEFYKRGSTESFVRPPAREINLQRLLLQLLVHTALFASTSSQRGAEMQTKCWRLKRGLRNFFYLHQL